MKQLIIILISLLTVSSGLTAQIEKSPYLFSEFKEALVYYKDARVFRVPMNYNLIIGKFVFIDKDEVTKEFSDPEMVVSIKIDDKTYLPTEGGATEILQFDPKVLVQYKGSVRKGGKKTTYGGQSETAAIDTYSRLRSSSGSAGLETENMILASVYKEYQLERGKRMRRFIGEKQFLKIFSKQKDLLKQYIEENEIDFNSVEQVLQLCNYAAGLK